MQRRIRGAALAAAFWLSTLPAAGAAEKRGSDLEIVRGPYLVADAETGQIVEEFDAQRPWFPASTTKLMTIYATFQAVRAGEIALAEQIKYSAYAAQQQPSKMGFKPGSTLTLDDALKMMMVKSANDIAVAVAEAIGGSVEGFSRRMNAAAEELGMERSHFVNPNGLPDERQVTSARDMALLARALLHDFPERRKYYAIPAIQIGGKILRNYNKLLTRFPGTTGMKTGFICASGYNLVASAERNGRELVAVVFGEYGGTLRNEHAAALLDAAFNTPPRRVETETTLYNAESGESYNRPFDMRPYVCGPKRAASVAELKGEDDESDVSHLTARIDLGPPIKVSAIIPADYGEPGFVARLPRARPGAGTGAEDGPPEVLPAFAPIDEGASASAPAEAIGAAAGEPHRLDEVKPE